MEKETTVVSISRWSFWRGKKKKRDQPRHRSADQVSLGSFAVSKEEKEKKVTS
jgi:hypothetical protein